MKKMLLILILLMVNSIYCETINEKSIIDKIQKLKNEISIIDLEKKVDNLLYYYPKSGRGNFFKAEIYFKKKEYKSAEKSCLKSIHSGLNNFDIYYLFGKIKYSLKKYLEANIYYKVAYSIDNNNTEFLIDYGILKIMQKEYTESLNHFNRALKLDNSKSEIYYYLSIAYFNLKNYQNCIYFSKKAIFYKCEIKDVYVLLSYSYYKNYNITSAKRYIEKAFEFKSNKRYSFAYYVKGKVYKFLADENEDFELYNIALKSFKTAYNYGYKLAHKDYEDIRKKIIEYNSF